MTYNVLSGMFSLYTTTPKSQWDWLSLSPILPPPLTAKHRSAKPFEVQWCSVYACCRNLYHRTLQPSNECNGAAADDGDDIDPKLRAAILKSRKLDRILQQKFQHEKSVKRERLQLHHRCVMLSVFCWFRAVVVEHRTCN